VNAPGMVSAIPSATIVLGPFGDIVNYGTGDFYFSWYPAGMLGSSREISPPEWETQPPDADRLRRDTIAALSKIVPAIGRLSREEISAAAISGGTIFAWGQTDIDDADSALHERYAIGPRSFGRFHSIDTGKLTTAPLFAKQMADEIRPLLA
jgi:hypothetical protein